MLLAFVLLLGTTAITASAAETTYEPIGGSTDLLVKNLVVDADANIPDITFSYTIRRGTPQDATADTIEILESPLTGGSIGKAVFSNADTENTINGLPSDADRNNPTAGKKFAQKSVSISFPPGTFTKPGVYRFVITETNNNLPGVTYDSNPTRYLDVFVVADDDNVLSVDSYVLRDSATDIGTDGAYVEEPGVKSSGYTNSLTQYALTAHMLRNPVLKAQAIPTALHSTTLISARRSPAIRVIKTRDFTSRSTSQALTPAYIP